MHTYNRASKFGKEELIKLKGETGNPTAAARCFRTPDGMMESSLHRTLSGGCPEPEASFAVIQRCSSPSTMCTGAKRGLQHALSPKTRLTNFKINKMGVFNNYNEVKKSPERNE